MARAQRKTALPPIDAESMRAHAADAPRLLKVLANENAAHSTLLHIVRAT